MSENPQDISHDQHAVRRQKLAELRAAGSDPFRASFVQTHFSGDALRLHVDGQDNAVVVAVDTPSGRCGRCRCARPSGRPQGRLREADKAMAAAPTVAAWNADAGYRGSFVAHLQTRGQRPVHISQRILDGFAVWPQRWVVERTFAWFNGQRRLGKDFEQTTSSSEAMIMIAALARNLRSSFN